VQGLPVNPYPGDDGINLDRKGFTPDKGESSQQIKYIYLSKNLYSFLEV
jgi:hypothetical protein